MKTFAIIDLPTEELADPTKTVMQTLFEVWEGFVAHIPYLIAGVGVLVATWIAAKLGRSLIPRFLRSSKIRPSLRALFVRMGTVAIWILGLMLTAVVVFPGLSPTKALGGLGIVSLAVGLAFKDIIENFLAGFVLLWRYPFENGDYISCNGIEGQIEDIKIRMTEIRQTSGELVVVPNSILFTNPVDVLTNLPRRRVTIIAGVSYDTDVEEAVALIEKTVDACETVISDQPIQVFPKEFGSSSIDIEVTWWTKPRPVDVRRSRGEVVTAIKKALDTAGIEIPFPYRTLTFKEPIPLAANTNPASG